MINTRKIYEQMLKLPHPWKVVDVQLDEPEQQLKVFIAYTKNEGVCPETGEICKIFDRRDKTWRHLDSMDYETWIVCRLPRIKNSLGRYHDIPINWAEGGLEHTMKFENKSIGVLKATHCQSSAATLMRISPDKMCNIMHRAVARGLKRRDLTRAPVHSISIDEKSYGKGQRYISVLSDASNGRVLDVIFDRSEEAASLLLNKVFTGEQLALVQRTCCDMAAPFIKALKKIAPMPLLSMTSSM